MFGHGLISINRIDGQDRVLEPIFHLTQRSLKGQPDWRIFDYVWKENKEHFDIEAIVGVLSMPDNGYTVEICKLTSLSIRIEVDTGQTVIMPEYLYTAGQVGPGFVALKIQG